MCYFKTFQDCPSPHPLHPPHPLQGTAWLCAVGLGLGGLVPGPTDGQRPAAGVSHQKSKSNILGILNIFKHNIQTILS